MSDVKGGSWDGTDRPGFPYLQRKLVLPRAAQPGACETYLREIPGGAWIFAHDGTTTPEDGPWTFPGGPA
jgi:hypothetical protein